MSAGDIVRRAVRSGDRDDPYAEVFHRALCRGPYLERAIGVIYRPLTERASHYFRADLSVQFDAVIHIDRTRAVEPLERTAGWDAGEVAETFPTGI